ncbi:MAG: ABC transporter substrate-binding protein [Bacteroidota bacterium]
MGNVRRLVLACFVLTLLASIVIPSVAATQIQVNFWHHEAPSHRVAGFQKVIDAFMKQNPGIKVTQHVVPWGDAVTKALSAVSAGNPPDFMFSLPDLTLTMKQTGGIIPADEVVKAIDAKYGFIKSQLSQYYYDGHYWGVPVFTMSYGLSYRPSYFKQYVGTTSPPKTWDQFLEYAKKCTVDVDNDGKIDIYGIGLGTAKNLLCQSEFYSLMINVGATLYDKDGRVNFNSPATVRALKFFKELSQYAPPGSTSWDWGIQEMSFASGKVAMMMGNGIPCARRFYEAKNFDLEWAEQPYPADGVRGSINFCNDVTIFKQVKDRGNYEAVKKFITFMLSPEMNTIIANTEPMGFLPVTTSGSNYKGWWQNPMTARFPDAAKRIIESVKYGKLYGFEYGKPNPAIAGVAGSNILAEIAQKVVVGEMTPEQAAKWGHEQIEKLSAN